jgi:hypothetical protein
MARQDTLRAAAIADGVRKASEKIRADVEAEIERRVQARSGDSQYERERRERERTELEGYRRALGVVLLEEPDGYGRTAGRVTADELADLAALLRTSGELAEATQALVGRYGPISSMRRHWEDLDQALRDAAAAATAPGQHEAGGAA